MRHFDVVAEDLVVADLERLDAGALALDALQVGHPCLCVARGEMHAIQFGAVAGLDEAVVIGFISDGGFNEIETWSM